MINPTLSLAVEGEALKGLYAAINRNDIPGVLEKLDPQIEWSEPPEFHMGGTRRGLPAVRDHFTEARDSWAEGSCEVERLLVAGDKIIVFVHVHVRLKHEAEWRDGNVTDVHTFRGGRIISARVFADREQALEWAGVEASAAT